WPWSPRSPKREADASRPVAPRTQDRAGDDRIGHARRGRRAPDLVGLNSVQTDDPNDGHQPSTEGLDLACARATGAQYASRHRLIRLRERPCIPFATARRRTRCSSKRAASHSRVSIRLGLYPVDRPDWKTLLSAEVPRALLAPEADCRPDPGTS